MNGRFSHCYTFLCRKRSAKFSQVVSMHVRIHTLQYMYMYEMYEIHLYSIPSLLPLSTHQMSPLLYFTLQSIMTQRIFTHIISPFWCVITKVTYGPLGGWWLVGVKGHTSTLWPSPLSSPPSSLLPLPRLTRRLSQKRKVISEHSSSTG